MRNVILLALVACLAMLPCRLTAGTRSVLEHGVLRFFDSGTGEKCTNFVAAPYYFEDEFIGAYFQKYTTNENTTSPWKTVETNLNTAIGISADEVGGALSIALDSDNNAERGVIYFGDNECFSIYSGCVFEARVKFSVAQTGVATCVIGLAGADNADADTIDVGAWFRVHEAAATALLWETDDNVTNDDDNAAATIGATSWYVLRIVAFDEDAVQFWVNGALVGTGAMSGLDATTGKVQPYIAIQKGTGTGVGTLLVDYVRVWGWR